MTLPYPPKCLADAAPELERILKRSRIHTPPRVPVSQIRCEAVMVAMRDGVRLATDLYLPPVLPAPAIAMRSPYGRAADSFVGVFLSFARRGYVVISQDVRGTGDSEPESWDFYMYEPEDGYDLIEWASQQSWFSGFLGACGSSYSGQTQWHMAMHPLMSAIAPEVSGLGLAINTANLHMFCNAYAPSVGKGENRVPLHYSELEGQMLQETLATGYFNDPLQKPFPDSLLTRFPILRELPRSEAKRWLWEHYCGLGSSGRAAMLKQALGTKSISILDVGSLSSLFGHQISHDSHTLPHSHPDELCQRLQAPVLLHTGWYDWCLNDAFATWDLLMRAPEPIRSRCRLVITPSAHNSLGYREGLESHPELQHAHRTVNNVELLLKWYEAVREGETDSWPTVIYYLMGANEWRVASGWPVPEAREISLYLGAGGKLQTEALSQPSAPDCYTYDPHNPAPTVGGSIVSYVYPAGSVDVSEVQKRQDVLTYTTKPFEHDVDVVGPLRLILYASSSAVDTDFSARISDVFPDGRAIQLQCNVLRARHRNITESELLHPGHIYRFEIDLWATANRFKASHRLRLDVSSADFPKFDRNSNRGGESGDPISAQQSVYHDPDHPSHLLLSVLDVNQNDF